MLGTGVAIAIVGQLGDLQRVDAVHDRALTAHSDQLTIRSSDFGDVFEAGDVFFDTDFNALDGGGANVGRGQRFTRVPRADLRGPGEWFNHQPERETGPNAAACTDCHRGPGDGAGPTGSNVHRDPCSIHRAPGVDEVGTGAGTFLTENLWGVASTAPYLHDGRATTLAAAILEHGGEARSSATFFRTVFDANRSNPNDTRASDLIAALENLVLFFEEEEE